MESLKNKKIIDNIFSNGKSLYTKTIKVKYIPSDSPEVLIAVSSKIWNRAVDRNRIKRLMRESVRTKDIGNFSIAFIYLSKEIESFQKINSDIEVLIEKI